jgi:NTP pyrophosphatase (non-canonical NTP hydrolase)
MGEIQDIQKALQNFAIEKNWEKYHTIRNLVLALGSEVGELQAEFRWMSDEETNNLDEAKKRSIEDEIADVAIFLFRLTDVLKIDIYQAVQEKIEKNSKRVTRGPEFTS